MGFVGDADGSLSLDMFSDLDEISMNFSDSPATFGSSSRATTPAPRFGSASSSKLRDVMAAAMPEHENEMTSSDHRNVREELEAENSRLRSIVSQMRRDMEDFARAKTAAVSTTLAPEVRPPQAVPLAFIAPSLKLKRNRHDAGTVQASPAGVVHRGANDDDERAMLHGGICDMHKALEGDYHGEGSEDEEEQKSEQNVDVVECASVDMLMERSNALRAALRSRDGGSTSAANDDSTGSGTATLNVDGEVKPLVARDVRVLRETESQRAAREKERESRLRRSVRGIKRRVRNYAFKDESAT